MSNDGDPVGAKDRTVGGRYRLLERIGSGGTGTVWRAHDALVDREVAVKQPRLPGHPEDEVYRRAAHRLYREARAAARVDHPSAVSILDVVVEEGQADAGGDGLPWIVMELIRGESLHQVLARGPLDPAEAARIGLAVLGALRAAHAVGIVHRDVKPANVLLGPHGRVVLTDFGIAHIQGEESLTATGEFVGSLEFVAPERMSGRGAGPASDLWSLGVLLHTAVEGRPPFRRTTPESTLTAILTEAPPTPDHAGPLAPLLLHLLTRDPAGRPGAEEAAAELEAVAGGRGLSPAGRGGLVRGGETVSEGGGGLTRDGDASAERRGVAVRDGDASVERQGVAVRDGDASAERRGVSVRDGDASVERRGVAAWDGDASVERRGVAAWDGDAPAEGEGVAARGRAVVVEGEGVAARGRAVAESEGVGAQGREAVAEGQGVPARDQGASVGGQGTSVDRNRLNPRHNGLISRFVASGHWRRVSGR
ncbi:protein kinase [Streptomyces sp. NPDC096132]|uniref:serine/threonine-protein kinase n=1 Tax=Streptomyces sp. NPDC096132 TaxID=3366075 RepID=UPI0038272325